MLEKIFIVYSVIVTLNPANKLCIKAALNLNNQSAQGLKTIGASLITGDNMEIWQPIRQTRNWLEAPMPKDASPLSRSMSMSTSTHSMIDSSSRIKLVQNKQQFLKAHQLTTDYVPYNHRSGNNNKLNITISSSVASASPNIKLKPSYEYLLLLNANKQLSPNPSHQHYLAKHNENHYPKIPKDIISQVQQPYARMNAIASTYPQYLADLNRHVPQPTQQHQQHHVNIVTTPSLKSWNFHPNPTESILSNDLNDLETKLIDSNFTNSTANNSQTTAEYDDVKNVTEKLLLLQKTFNNVIEFFDNIKDIIWSDKDNVEDIYSNEDDIDDDDNDLRKVNFAPGSDAAEATAEMLSSLKLRKTIPLSSTLLGEVQGQKRQIDKGTTMKYPLTSQRSETQNVLAKATRGLVWNILKDKSALASSTLPASTASLSTFATARKLKKKLKKKFQKFLLPLVLAYKLKFLALIPLLIGGLTLLVGTTGLAGFFFALFTAVMSLKSGAKSAIVVK